MKSVLKNFELHKCCSLSYRIQSCSMYYLNKCCRMLSVLPVLSNFVAFKCWLYSELLISLQIMFDMLYKLFETYFVSLIKLSGDVNHVVLCSHRC